MAPETREQRRKREKRQSEQKRALEDAALNVPSHLKDRVGGKSKLGESIMGGLSRYGWRGHRFNEDGHEIRSKPLGSDGAQATKVEADKRCNALREKYSDWWGNKKRVRQIAAKEGMSEKTIIRYFERCPK
jgi:hypothetical protein